jgi:hypothetical protein
LYEIAGTKKELGSLFKNIIIGVSAGIRRNWEERLYHKQTTPIKTAWIGEYVNVTISTRWEDKHARILS